MKGNDKHQTQDSLFLLKIRVKTLRMPPSHNVWLIPPPCEREHWFFCPQSFLLLTQWGNFTGTGQR